MPSYVNPFTGQTVQPSQVGYEQLTLSQDTELQWPINGNNSLIVANIIEVDATVAGIDIYMPAATQVSTGQSILFKNIGSNTFTVVDFSGNTIIAIASGIAEYVYITSSANAAALAGYGLKPISTTLNQAYTITNYFSNATFSAANRASFAVWEGGVGTLTLPVSSVVGNDWFIMIRNNGSGILTINPQGSDVIDDGLTSQQLQISESLVMVANGSTGFNTFGYGQAVNFYFTILSKVVTGLGSTITLTASEASNVIQEYSGILAANTNIIFPSTVQLYTVTNLTTGSYDLTFGTGAVGAATVTIPQNQSLVLICDGTNVYNANSATISVLPSLTINPGSAAAPTLNFLGNTTTGLFQPASGQVGLALNGVEKLTLEGDGLHVVDGILGGTF